jgi:hypothetical protein
MIPNYGKILASYASQNVADSNKSPHLKYLHPTSMKLPIIRLLWLLSAAACTATPDGIIDTVGGTCQGDSALNKAVRLLEVAGQEVTITGNVTCVGVTDAPPFEGFAVGSVGKRIDRSSNTCLP